MSVHKNSINIVHSVPTTNLLVLNFTEHCIRVTRLLQTIWISLILDLICAINSM